MKYLKKLMGERIYLSPRNSEDAEKYTEWMNDFHTTDYTGRSNQIMTIEAVFAIVNSNEDKLIGTVGVYRSSFTKLLL